MGASTGDIGMLGYLHWNPVRVNHFPRAQGPAAGQLGAIVRILFHRVLHPLGGRHAGAGKVVGTGLVWFLGLGLLLLGFELQTGHTSRAIGF